MGRTECCSYLLLTADNSKPPVAGQQEDPAHSRRRMKQNSSLNLYSGFSNHQEARDMLRAQTH